jgi:hypothetical protein
VDFGKLKRTMVREFQRSPAKTCVLLGMLPVAGYFIGPLIWKQVRPTKTPALAVARPVEIAAASPVGGAVAGATAGAAAVTWKDAATWMEMDSLMQATIPPAARNPFQQAKSEQDLANAKNASAGQLGQENALDNETRPEDLGLRLTATMVGNRIRIATINGKQYQENALINAAAGGAPEVNAKPLGGDAFVLKLVDRKFVILERNGKTYQLQLAR